ncbi:hypothetical protein QN416_11540 [Glaciimonas sp. Cout2]|nr:hypothetical protein [Glaciimonas sp. Cout2]MEB0012255.1 hypothetical protein [Glaciimonas sp. Cout2]
MGFAISNYGVEATSKITGMAILVLMFGVAIIPNIRLFMRMSEDELDEAYSRIYPAAFQ